MNSRFGRIRRGAVYLVIACLLSICGYLYVRPEHSVLDAIYWLVITISTVGYTEESNIPYDAKILSILVIIFGITAAAYTIGGFIQLITEGELERALGHRRMSREIEKLKGHVILCGCGRTGQILVAQLVAERVPFVVIDKDPQRVAEAEVAGGLVLQGDVSDENILKSAHVDTAKTLICALSDDADNVFLTLTARTLNPDLKIIARGEHPRTKDKLHHAGADQVVMPSVIGAQRIASLVTRPMAAELIDRVTDDSVLEVGIEELTIPEENPLVSQTVQNAETHRRHGLLIVAIRQEDGKMIFNPHADYTFNARDTLMLMGKQADIQDFCTRFKLQ